MLKKLLTGAGMLSLLLAWAAMPIPMLKSQAMAVTLEVYVPTAAKDIAPSQLAKRVETLNGMRIAIHWNGKPGGEWLLAEVEDQLKTRFKDFTVYHWPDGTAWKSDVEGFLKKQPVDVAILALGD